MGHVRAKPGHPRSHGQPGGGTVKPRSLATSLSPPPSNLFSCLEDGDTPLQKLGIKKKKKKRLLRQKMALRWHECFSLASSF